MYNNHVASYLNLANKAKAKSVATSTSTERGGLLQRSFSRKEDKAEDTNDMIVGYFKELNAARKALKDG